MDAHDHPRLAPNWTTAAGALEGILAWRGMALPRHAIMGLTGHAWHTCLQTRGDVTALPGGPADLDWDAMIRRYARTGLVFERFGGLLRPGDDWSEMRQAAIEWALPRLDAGQPLIGWDFHLHEHAVVYGYDRAREGFLVESVLTEEVGPLAPWGDWPSSVGMLELAAPIGVVDVDPVEALAGALETALDCFAGSDGPADGQPRGIAALDVWAEALEGTVEIDRAGNAYMIAVTQAARRDGADFLADVAASLPPLAEALAAAESALREEVQALAPLITLFPFPSGGHGNVANPGLRRAAAMAIRRAARYEERAREAIAEALDLLGEEA